MTRPDLPRSSHPLDAVTRLMDNLYDERTLGALMTPMTRAAKRRRRKMTQRRGIRELAACGKLESTHGAAPAPGGNHLPFFGFNKVILGGHVCNKLLIFIAPH